MAAGEQDGFDTGIGGIIQTDFVRTSQCRGTHNERADRTATRVVGEQRSGGLIRSCVDGRPGCVNGVERSLKFGT